MLILMIIFFTFMGIDVTSKVYLGDRRCPLAALNQRWTISFTPSPPHCVKGDTMLLLSKVPSYFHFSFYVDET